MSLHLRLLSAADLEELVPMAAAIAARREAFVALSAGRADVPLRTRLPVPEQEGMLLVMPAHVPEIGLATKLVSVFPRNLARGQPTLSALVVDLDPATGRPRAVIEGESLTALRTGAAGGLAADLLARPDARRAVLFGAGGQARAQLRALFAVRPIERVTVIARRLDSARAFAATVQDEPWWPAGVAIVASADRGVVCAADCVVAATTSATPVFDGRDLAASAGGGRRTAGRAAHARDDHLLQVGRQRGAGRGAGAAGGRGRRA